MTADDKPFRSPTKGATVASKSSPLIAVLALSAAAGACGPAAVAHATASSVRASTTVTIQTKNGDFWGTLTSPRPKRCADQRKVWLYKQAGATQDPSVDQRIASDISSLSGGRYRWSTGTTGLRHGRFYARVVGTPFCKGDTSNTVRSTPSP